MAKVGAELPQMQQLKRTFDKHTREVNALMASINRQVDATWWEGPAAKRFRDAWRSEFQPALRKLETALGQASTEVQRRHDAIQRAGS